MSSTGLDRRFFPLKGNKVRNPHPFPSSIHPELSQSKHHDLNPPLHSISFTLPNQKQSTKLYSFPSSISIPAMPPHHSLTVRSYKVIQHEGQSTELEVEPDENMLSKSLTLVCMCTMKASIGVCMTWSAQLFTSTTNSEGIRDDVVEGVHPLLCAAYPRFDINS